MQALQTENWNTMPDFKSRSKVQCLAKREPFLNNFTWKIIAKSKLYQIMLPKDDNITRKLFPFLKANILFVI